MQHINSSGLTGFRDAHQRDIRGTRSWSPSLHSRGPIIAISMMRHAVDRNETEKKPQAEDDDVRAWVIIALIFCAVAVAVWVPLVIERHWL